jgi:CDP-6-deoxy-D-xylo-4-hexulose-3-dehydrase
MSAGGTGGGSGADAERLRAQIMALVEQYYEAAFAAPAEFVPGTTRIPYAGRVFDAAELLDLVDSSLEFWLTHGRYADRLERQLAEYLGIKHCYLVSSGSSANLLALTALTSDRLGARKLLRGDEVITVAAGFPTTVAPIVQYGAVPVFVDVDPVTANVDVTQLEDAWSPRTKAVFLAHTLGNPFDVATVQAFCEEYALWLIEDNCDALGSRYGGRLTGGFGHIGTSSFYPPHHITMGEGGAVYTESDELAGIVRSLRDWGRDCECAAGEDNHCGRRFDRDFGTLPHGYDHKYVFSHFGFNLKVTEMQAAIGGAQLAKLPRFVEARRRNFVTLSRLLAPLGDVLALPQATVDSEPSWFGFLMTLREGAEVAGAAGAGRARDGLVAELERRQIQTRMLFAGNMVRQPCFDAMRASRQGYRVVGDLAATDTIMNDAFWVGVYPGLTDEMLTYMAQSIAEALGRRLD